MVEIKQFEHVKMVKMSRDVVNNKENTRVNPNCLILKLFLVAQKPGLHYRSFHKK